MNLASTLSHLQTAKRGLRFARNLPRLASFARVNPATLVAEWAKARPHNTALLFEEERWNWRQLNEEVDRWANWLISRNVRAGEVMAILMENRPDYIFLAMALNRIGAIAALINTNLSGEPLRHSLKTSNAHHLFVDEVHRQTVDEALQKDTPLPHETVYILEEESAGLTTVGIPILDELRATVPKLHQNDYAPRNADVFCYIFTSGTTGMPKAAIIRNQRMLGASYLFGRMMHACNGGDIVYVTLPLYHTNAMLLGWGSALATGAGIALRQKFSASSFWLDIVRYQATSFVYIGELCRYLLNTPSIPEERDHRLRVAVGNGLRPDIWNDFTERFNIPLMREFYGSTEGNAPAINFSGRPGMIGKLGHSQLVLRCDPSTGDVIRASNGRCIVAQPGEVGLLVGKISKIMSFEGYLDSRATNAKILSGIRKANDRYFNTGDLVQLHDDNWLSFVDRVGDTFRWKGENVSTTEVAEIINGAQGIVESNVYGVLVPNTDGRAGMAAIRISDHFDLTRFASYVSEELPHYQRPVFLRVLEEEMLVTGTFKHKKVAYRDEGFDPQSITDSLYVRGDGPDYIPLTPDRHAAIVSGQYAQL